MNLEQVPGLREAAVAIHRVTNGQVNEPASLLLAAVALRAASPHLKLECVADMSDGIREFAATFTPDEGSAAMVWLADQFDTIANDLRRELT